MENLTKLIRENNKKDLNKNSKIAVAIIASVFSVLFSLSIVFELKNVVNGFVLGFLVIFVMLFLVLNERIKVESIKKMYRNERKSIISFSITFIISVTLSSIGIYLWTNKSFNEKIKTSDTKANEIVLIKEKYNNKISEVASFKFSDTELYNELKESVDFWKSRRAADFEERSYIRTQIKKAEDEFFNARLSFEDKQNNNVQELKELMNAEISRLDTMSNNKLEVIDYQSNISYIFLIMILITEIGIIILNKEVVSVENDIESLISNTEAKKYLLARSVLISLFLTKNKDNKTTITHALHSSPVNDTFKDEDKKWNAVKNLYNLFINLGILDDGEVKKNKEGKNILINTIILNEKEALKKFDEYYDKLLSI